MSSSTTATQQTPSPIDEELLKKIKILYIHGVEGSPQRDKKAQLLLKTFPNARCPDMRTTELMASGRLYVSLGSAAGIGIIGYISYLLGIKKNKLLAMFAFILVSGTGLAFLVRWGMRRVLKNTFNNSLEIQRRYIKNFKPDLIIASTYGGAVMAEIMRAQKYFYKNPLLMLAPAQDELARRLGESPKSIIIPKTIPKAIIVHGKKDQIVPYQDSLDYVSRSKSENPNVQVRLVDEDHRLTNTVTEECMKRLVSELLLNDDQQ